MGLDCNVMARPKGEQEAESEELWYGRKTNEIHGWMDRQWTAQGNTEVFNCEELVLTAELLNQLEADSKGDGLPTTQGFFFGGSNNPEDVREDVKTILEVSRTALAEGKEVYYTSWW